MKVSADALTTLLLLLLTFLLNLHLSESYIKYTEQSCTDLTPKSFHDYTDSQITYPSSSSSSVPLLLTSSKLRLKKSILHLNNEVEKNENYNNYEDLPYKLIVDVKRYRRDSDVTVKLEGSTSYDAMMIQARAIPGTTEVYLGTSIGLVGIFRYLKKPYKYLSCFDIPYGTVISGSHHKAVPLGNVTLFWKSPDQDVGDIRFIASILRGINYWIIVSNTLTFNPFPISTYSCGSTISCFRVCPYDMSPCTPRESKYVFTYHADFVQNGEVEITIGGRIPNNQSYIAVAFGNDYKELAQAEMIACHLYNGRAELKHLLIENIQLPLLEPQHRESVPYEVDDYDLDGSMLWCRFKRPVNPDTIINPRLNLYHFHFWGSTDFFHQNFHLPKREFIYSSRFRKNFSSTFSEIIACANISAPISWCTVIIIGIILILFGN